MKNSYFYRKSIIYSSLIIFTLITGVLFFINDKMSNLFQQMVLKSQKHMELGAKIVEENIEKEILNFIGKIREKNQRDLDEIVKDPYIFNMFQKGQRLELEKLLNVSTEEYMHRVLEVKEEALIANGNKVEIYDKGLLIISQKQVEIEGKTYTFYLKDYLNKEFLKNTNISYIIYGDLIILKELESFKYLEKLKLGLSDRIVEKKDDLREVYKIYLPFFDEHKKLIAVILYEVDMTFYKGLNKEFSDESDFLISNIRIYTLIFGLAVYFFSILFIQILLKRFYNPLEEIFRVIDDLSKGKFGRKAYIEKHEELKPLVRKINRLSGNLNFMNRLKNEFLVKKTYEFKEVLDNIVGISQELIKDRKLNSELKEELKIIFENSTKLLTITKSLNDYYVLDDENVILNESINLKKVIDEVSTILTHELQEKNLYINNLISEKIYIKGDSLKLFILFTNLLDNSIKNSQYSEIRIEGKVEDSMLKVVISDKGRGINIEKLKNIVSYFNGSEETEEIGLGFILAKKIVDLHGGEINLWSSEGQGTNVSFTLQEALFVSDRDKEKLEELKRELKFDTIYGENKILIYCNNYLNCQILINFLKGKNYVLDVVETKEELLNYLEYNPVDLIILDILGDFLSDYRLIRDIREKFEVKDLPIIFVNNRKKLDEDFSIFDLGINDVMEKPLLKEKLLLKVENQLQIVNSKKANKNLEKEKYMEASLSSIQEEISTTLNPKKIFYILLKKIKEIVDYDSAFILLKKDNKYGIIFQDGLFDKEEKNDRLFKSRYLDPITNEGRIIRLSKFRCQKYFGGKIKASVVIPFKYGNNSNCVIVLKSKQENFFRAISKELIDRVSFNLSNSIKNAELYNELEEKNNHLSNLFDTLQSIDKLTSVVYKEQDKNTAIYYILLILINKLKLGYKEAYYFEYSEEQNNLHCSNYFYSLKNYTEEKETKVSAKEIWTKKIKLKLDKSNILTRAFKENDTSYLRELTTEDHELFGKMLKITVVPVRYIDEKFGLIVLESDRKKKNVDEIEKEALRIIGANLGIYLYNKKLERDNIRTTSSKTLNTFAKAIIHELRTPIVGVKGFASIVKDRYSDDKRLLNYMDSIINDSNRVLELSSQIVDYAEEKNMIYTFIEDNIKNTIEEILEEFREQIELEDLMIFRPLGDLFLVFDKSKIKRVFKHIIKNSLENIDYEKDEHYLKISFEKNKFGTNSIVFFDNGVGVAEESIQNIFEPLVSGKIQGTGLGLPISKNIIEKHNWDLKFESVKYNYTKVTIMTK